MPTWTLVSASIAPTAGVVNVASSSLTGTIVLNVKATGGSLTKPLASQFNVWFASSTARTTNGGTAFTALNGINVTPSITVSPTDATVGDGGSYTVTIVGTLQANNPSLGSSQALFLAINQIVSVIGGITVTQNWGIDTFMTPSTYLTR
jgi:hypothetical protein